MTLEPTGSRPPASRHPLLGPSLTIECARCPVRETGCGDCMVTALLQMAPPVEDRPAGDLHWPSLETSMSLDSDERAAVDAFARAGLISTAEALGARAHLDGPHAVVATRHVHGQGHRAVG